MKEEPHVDDTHVCTIPSAARNRRRARHRTGRDLVRAIRRVFGEHDVHSPGIDHRHVRHHGRRGRMQHHRAQRQSIGLSFKKSIYPLVVALVMGVFVLLGTAMKNEGMVSDWPLQLALVIMLCLLVGTFEEGLFRGVVFSGLLARFGETRRGLIGAVIVSSLIFGFVHVTPSIMNGQVVTGLDMAQAALKTLQAGILGAFLAACS